MWFGFKLALVLFATSVAQAQPAFDPRAYRTGLTGAPTQVLTIGSTHLGQRATPLDPALLEPLLAKLAAFKPDIITHEGRTGEQCDVLQRYSARYPDMFETYCFGTAEAEKATGLTVPAAMAQVETTLAAWPATPTFAQRRHLAALFLAANDRPSARVQWLQLPPAERRSGDGIDPALLKIVTRAGAKLNETYDIAVELAARLGLQRVYAVDDHTADSVQGRAGKGFETFLSGYFAGAKPAFYEEMRRRDADLPTGAAVLDYYRYLNRPAMQRAFVESDQLAAAKAVSPGNYGRVYLAWWEVRNLRMVANIREAFGDRPGARVLNIVGSSHKPVYDAYLDLMTDVQLVDAEAVLH